MITLRHTVPLPAAGGAPDDSGVHQLNDRLAATHCTDEEWDNMMQED